MDLGCSGRVRILLIYRLSVIHIHRTQLLFSSDLAVRYRYCLIVKLVRLLLITLKNVFYPIQALEIIKLKIIILFFTKLFLFQNSAEGKSLKINTYFIKK